LTKFLSEQLDDFFKVTSQVIDKDPEILTKDTSFVIKEITESFSKIKSINF